jgi:transposase
VGGSERFGTCWIHRIVPARRKSPFIGQFIAHRRETRGISPIPIHEHPHKALTWALEIGDVARFQSIKQAISYCGLCGAEKSSADKVMRTPISKQRNKYIQQMLIEAAKLAPRQP